MTPISRVGPASLAFFDATHRTFLEAERAAGGATHRFFDVAGQIVRLSFAGPALISRLAPALAHAETRPTAAPALTVCVWDGASTGTRMPRLPWAGVSLSRRGEVQGFGDDRVRTVFDRTSDLLSCLDTRRHLALFCTPAAESIPTYETATPFTAILSWWLRSRELEFVHAGAVAWAGHGVLLTGDSGSGKTTSALACLSSTLGYLGDDTCAVATDSTPRVWNIYNTAKLTRDCVDRLPHLRAAVSNPGRLDQEKAVLFVSEHRPERLERSCSVEAILLPRITTRVTPVLKPAPASAGARALGLGSLLRFAGVNEEALRNLVRLCQTVPCYYLELGSNLAGIPEVIHHLLSGRSTDA
jgi:hypothetical protein